MPKKSNHKKSGMSDFPTYHSKSYSHSLKIQVIYYTVGSKNSHELN